MYSYFNIRTLHLLSSRAVTSKRKMFHKLSHSFMFRHYRVVSRELVINSFTSYTIVNCIANSCIWNTCVTCQGIIGNYRLPDDDTIDSVETCRIVIICEVIVHLLVIILNKLFAVLRNGLVNGGEVAFESCLEHRLFWDFGGFVSLSKQILKLSIWTRATVASCLMFRIYCHPNIRRKSRWPHDLRRGSAAARLLVLRVRIPPVAWIFVCCVCCQVEVSASGWSLVQRNPTEFGMSECDRETSIMRRPCPTRGCCIMKGDRVKYWLLR
jgi:hypothetical protein